MATEEQLRLEIENLDLRRLLTKAGVDAAEKKVMEGLQQLLLLELHHRIKNTLAMVTAIISQTLRTAASLEHGQLAIEHRLAALSRVHDVLLETNWTHASLAKILKAATEPFNEAESSRFVIQSADLDVSAEAVLPLAMVLNELCTNAVKYGALSASGGGVEITATADLQHHKFRLRWTERGGPPVVEPARRSFGSRLIEHSFVRQLEGEAQLTFHPAGVVCVLDIPLNALLPRADDRTV